MADKYRYIIVTLPHANEAHSKAICVGNPETQRETLPTAPVRKLLVKTSQRLINNYLFKNPHVTENMLFPPGQSTEYHGRRNINKVLEGPHWTVPLD